MVSRGPVADLPDEGGYLGWFAGAGVVGSLKSVALGVASNAAKYLEQLGPYLIGNASGDASLPVSLLLVLLGGALARVATLSVARGIRSGRRCGHPGMAASPRIACSSRRCLSRPRGLRRFRATPGGSNSLVRSRPRSRDRSGTSSTGDGTSRGAQRLRRSQARPVLFTESSPATHQPLSRLSFTLGHGEYR